MTNSEMCTWVAPLKCAITAQLFYQGFILQTNKINLNLNLKIKLYHIKYQFTCKLITIHQAWLTPVTCCYPPRIKQFM